MTELTTPRTANRVDLPGGLHFVRVAAFADGYELRSSEGVMIGPQWWKGEDARAFFNILAQSSDSDSAAAEALPETLAAVPSDRTSGELLKYLGDDVAKWAAEFRKIAIRLGYSDMDEGWLIGWFASAIEHSGDVRRWRREKARTPAEIMAEWHEEYSKIGKAAAPLPPEDTP
jgi:hypothetical protein